MLMLTGKERKNGLYVIENTYWYEGTKQITTGVKRQVTRQVGVL